MPSKIFTFYLRSTFPSQRKRKSEPFSAACLFPRTARWGPSPPHRGRGTHGFCCEAAQHLNTEQMGAVKAAGPGLVGGAGVKEEALLLAPSPLQVQGLWVSQRVQSAVGLGLSLWVCLLARGGHSGNSRSADWPRSCWVADSLWVFCCVPDLALEVSGAQSCPRGHSLHHRGRAGTHSGSAAWVQA